MMHGKEDAMDVARSCAGNATERLRTGETVEASEAEAAEEARRARENQGRELALRILDKSRVQLMMAFRFLDRALWKMPFRAADAPWPLATDCRTIAFDPDVVISMYRACPALVVRTYLHAILHCIFRHPLRTVRVDPELWSMACDICVEAIALDLCDGRFGLEDDRTARDVLAALGRQGVAMTPAGVYRALLLWKSKPCTDKVLMLLLSDPALAPRLFVRDSHELWDLRQPPKPRQDADTGQQGGGMPANDDADGQADDQPGDRSGDGVDEEMAASNNREPDDDLGQLPESEGEDGREGVPSEPRGLRDESGQLIEPRNNDSLHEDRQARGREKPDRGSAEGAEDDVRTNDASPLNVTLGGGAGSSAENDPSYAEGALASAREALDKSLEREWQEIAQQMEAALQTLERKRGEGAGNVMGNLELATRSRIDYASFLRRFATWTEDVKLNDEEFDYLFYTYGLAHYGNMPLVEPLEYTETERVREFAIAIDTSGSCANGLIRIFLTRTCEILSHVVRPGEKLNVHIIQCDAEVQSDTVVTCLDDLRDFERDITVHGIGGTDFRPVFAYVDDLVARKVFADLRGLVYFTDGFGVFPDHAPSYDAAFVFVENEGRERRVPPWACKVVMDDFALEELDAQGMGVAARQRRKKEPSFTSKLTEWSRNGYSRSETAGQGYR